MGPVGADLLKTVHSEDAMPNNISHVLLNVLIVSLTVTKLNTLTQEIVSNFLMQMIEYLVGITDKPLVIR